METGGDCNKYVGSPLTPSTDTDLGLHNALLLITEAFLLQLGPFCVCSPLSALHTRSTVFYLSPSPWCWILLLPGDASLLGSTTSAAAPATPLLCPPACWVLTTTSASQQRVLILFIYFFLSNCLFVVCWSLFPVLDNTLIRHQYCCLVKSALLTAAQLTG